MQKRTTPRPLALLLLGAGLALPGLAAAHAEFVAATPGRAEIVTAQPEVVTLEFSEPVEVRFSVFKVYPLPDPATTSPTTSEADTAQGTPEPHHHGAGEADAPEADPPGEDAAMTLDSEEALRLNGLAGLLVSEVIELRGDEDARADAGLVTRDARSAAVTLALKPKLPAGTYVLMWRVLSIDTHVTQGFSLFVIAPP